MATKRKAKEEPALTLPLAREHANAALVDLETAEVQQEASKLRVKIAKADVEYFKKRFELQQLQEESAVGGKRARTLVAVPWAAATPGGVLDLAQQRLAAARQGLKALQEELRRRRERQQRAVARLAEGRSAIRDRQVDPAVEAEWLEKELVCDLDMLLSKPHRDTFLSKLTTAPCLGSLWLDLAHNDYNSGAWSDVPASVVQALTKVPAKTRKLRLELEPEATDLLFALLERTKGHLEELELMTAPKLSDDQLRRLWAFLLGSRVTAVTLRPALLRDVGLKLKAGSWSRVRKLDFSGWPAKRKKWLCSLPEPTPPPPPEPDMLVPLLRACAASLRSVGLPWEMPQKFRKPVYGAVAACPGLKELSTPCYPELSLTHAHLKLTHLRLVSKVCAYVKDDDGKIDERLQVASDILLLPSTALNLESLTLRTFQLDHDDFYYMSGGNLDSDDEPISDDEEFVTDSILGLKLLRQLTLEECDGIGGALEKALPELSCLEVLRIVRPKCMELDALTQWVTPENAPFLHTLELDWTMWGPGEETDDWFRALRNIRDDFRVDCPDFRIKLTRWGHRDPTKDSDREEWETGGEGFGDF